MLSLAMVFTTISPLLTVQAAVSVPVPTSLSSNLHPRVLFTADDVESIKAVVEGTFAERDDSENSSARAYFRRRADVRAEDNTDNGDPVNNSGWNEKKLAGIEAKALAYALKTNVHNKTIKKSGRDTGYEELGARAVQYLKKYLETIDIPGDSSDETTRSRAAGEVLHVAAEVYDWCYDLFDKDIQAVCLTAGGETPAEGTTAKVTKAEIRSLVSSKLLPYLEMGSNFSKQSAVEGHGAEAQLLRDGLSWAIAVYGEDTTVWNNVAQRFYGEYVPVRNEFLPTGWNLQGTEYGFYRNQWDAWAYMLITGMGGDTPYNEDAVQGLGEAALGITYARRPDGQFFRDGDVPVTATKYFQNWNKYNSAFMSAAVSQNEYSYGEYIETKPTNSDSFYENTAVPVLVMSGRNNAALAKTAPKSTKNLPLTKFFGGAANIMFARTGWGSGPDSNAAVAMMKVGGKFVNNHQHYDAGTFQLYYKGILASESGYYQGIGGTSDYSSNHHDNYYIKTVAHNGLLIGGSSQNTYFSLTKPSKVGDEKTVASLSSYAVDQTNPENPSFSYLKGDISQAYGGGVDYERSFVFLNLKRADVPAAMIVYDYVDSTSSKTWLVHSVNKPTITGQQAVFKNTRSDETGSYNGKMTVDTLLPASATLTAADGFKSGSSTYSASPANVVDQESNGARLEVSGKSSDHQFLNVMQVSDADKSNYLAVTKLTGTNVVGAQIADKVVTFSAGGGALTGSFSFTAPAGTYEYILTDVKRGAWKVSTDSGFSSYDYVPTTDDENSNVLHFTKTLNSATTLYFQYHAFTDSGITPSVRTLGESTRYDFFDIEATNKATGNPIATTYDAVTDENGMPLVEVDDLAAAMDASVSVVGDTATFTKAGKTVSFTLGSATMTRDGVLLDKSTQAVPVMFRDHMYVSPISIAAYFGAKYVLDKDEELMTFTANYADGDFVIEYSVDGVNYTPVPNFAIGTKEYDIELPYQTNVAYVRATNSLGTQYFSNTNATYDAQRAEGTDDSFVWSSATLAAQEQFGWERFLSVKGGKSMDDCATPIKNEYGTTKMYYTAPMEDTEDVYTINFHAPQPKLTYASSHLATTSSSVYAYPMYIGGGAAWNDNGTILDPRFKNNSCRTWALGNISPSLQGASMFMIPMTEIIYKDRTAGPNPSRTSMFTFSADAPGRVIVLMAKPAGGNSGLVTDYSWREGSHNGTGINGVKAGSNLTNKVSGKPSADAQYHAIAYKWISAGTDKEGESTFANKSNNDFRTKYPGVIESPNNVSGSTKESKKLLYSYYKDFDEHEDVVVPNPCNIKLQNDTSESFVSDDIVAVFVQYYDDPTPPVTGEALQIQYYGKDGVRHAIYTDDADANNNIEVTLPNNSQYAYVSFDAVDTTSIPTEVKYTYSVEAKDEDDDALPGTNFDGKERIGGASLAQASAAVNALKDGSTFTIPIKNENSVAHFNYGGKEYTISFKARQPRLTSISASTGTNNFGDDSGTADASNCISHVLFVGGAAANNDNGSIMQTNVAAGSTDSNANTGYTHVRFLANISKELVGTSMFVLPRMKKASSGVTFFKFKADTDGRLIIISDSKDSSGSKLSTSPWSKGDGFGNFALGTSDGELVRLQPRTYNDYSKKYHAESIAWWINSSDSSLNHYRLSSPGVEGTINNSDVNKGSTDAKYAGNEPVRSGYSMWNSWYRDFEAGEEVLVPAFQTSADSAMFIKWAEEKPVAGPLSMTFSSDDENFTHMKFDKDKTEYNVTLADNAKYAYVQFDVEDPTVIPENLFTTYDVDATGIDGSQLVGTVGQTGRKIDDQSLCQIAVPMEAQRSSNSGAYKVPIKNENGKLTFKYDGIYYTINFTAKQPRLTELTSYTADTSAEVLFVGGGAVNNDNGTVTQTSRNSTDNLTGNAVDVRTLTNVSEKLLGSSIFMLPDLAAGDSNLFTFTADHAGTVFVMSDTAINGSGYTGAGTAWTCRNDGSVTETNITGTTFPNSAKGYRNSNSYGSAAELQYYSRSTNWWTTPNSSSEDSFHNKRRAYYANGITGYIKANSTSPNSTDLNGVYRGTWGMNYIYSLSFEAGQQVTIPGLWTDTSSPDSAVLVIWDDDDMSGIGYEWNDDASMPAIDENGDINIDASQLTSSGDKAEKLFVATYDENDRMLGVESGDSAVQTFHVGDEYDPAGNKTIGIFVNDLKVFRPSVTIKLKVSE